MIKNFSFIPLCIIFCSLTPFDQRLHSPGLIIQQDSSMRTKRYYKNGLKYEEDYQFRQIRTCRIYIGDKLMYTSPIARKNLQPSAIKLKSGNHFISRKEYDTLEIINPQIPPMNFAIQVTNGQVSYTGVKLYLIRASASAKPGIDKLAVYIKVYQQMNPKIKIPVFISDSVFFDIK